MRERQKKMFIFINKIYNVHKSKTKIACKQNFFFFLEISKIFYDFKKRFLKTISKN